MIYRNTQVSDEHSRLIEDAAVQIDQAAYLPSNLKATERGSSFSPLSWKESDNKWLSIGQLQGWGSRSSNC